MKKAEKAANAAAREAERERYAREEAAMQAFLAECRACLPADVGEREFAEAERSAGRTFHVVEWMVSVLAATQLPIPPRLRRALDTMLVTLGVERSDPGWQALRRLNYSAYWKARYGY